MNRIDRIKEMEEAYELSESATNQLEQAIANYEDIERKFLKLQSYYGSVQWLKDYEADEAGKLPRNLKREVLSEDGVYDLLTKHRQLMVRLLKIATNTFENE